MSRIIKSLIKSANNKPVSEVVVFLDPNKPDPQILALPWKLISFENEQLAKPRWDTNNLLLMINPDAINSCFSLLPDIVLSNTLIHYPNAKSLAQTLKLPLVNIIRENIGIKTDQMLNLARNELTTDINLLSSNELANKLFIMNYHLLEENLNEQITILFNEWVP